MQKEPRVFTTFAAEHFSKAAVFAAVVKTGSFSKAAKSLGLARSTISEHIQALEKAFELRLLERTTRKLRLTDEGELFYSQLTGILDAWDDLTRLLEEQSDGPSGILRVTAPAFVTRTLIAPVLARLLAMYPRLQVELEITDQIRDMLAERLDVAIRMAPLETSGLIARKLGETPLVLVASPSYAKKCGKKVEGLSELSWVGHRGVPRESLLLVHQKSGLQKEITIPCRVWSATTEGMIALTEEGVGVAVVPQVLVHTSLEAGRLVRVFSSYQSGVVPLFAVYPSRSYVPLRLRLFLDALEEHVKGLL